MRGQRGELICQQGSGSVIQFPPAIAVTPLLHSLAERLHQKVIGVHRLNCLPQLTRQLGPIVRLITG
nr:hypothetical protein DOP62_09260 [Synechococcus elongatus PCC 11801]